MGKREAVKFDKKPRDSYYTIDPAATLALVPHLDPLNNYVEPCAGGGDLIKQIRALNGPFCVGSYDIEPQDPNITQRNCLTLSERDLWGVDLFVTNPPFTWSVLKPIIDHLTSLRPAWMLLPADYMHNVRVGPYMKQCSKVVSVGRLYWEENKVKGVDNFAWFLFTNKATKTEFIGR